MSSSPANSIFDSLKGRIRLAAFVLAVAHAFTCAFAYSLYSFTLLDPFSAISISVGGILFSTIAFGFWLASEITRPIETLTLFARSLERSPSAALPSTTGSTETDELLSVLTRSSRQMQNLITLMDDVAAGRTESAFAPLENADRLSVSFQKLVSKVTDSITARRELDDLAAALSALNIEASQARQMHLDLEFRASNDRLRGISETLRFLASTLRQNIEQAKSSSLRANNLISDARRAMNEAIERRETKIAGISVAVSTQRAKRLREIVSQLASVLETRSRRTVSAPDDSGQIKEVDRLASLKSRIHELSRRIRRFRDRTSGLNSFARSAFEMARRANLIALNTTIQENVATAGAADIIIDELTLLSERSSILSREIRDFQETLAADLADLENILNAANDEIVDEIRLTMAKVSNSADTEKLIDQIHELVRRIDLASHEAAEEADKLSSAIELLSDVEADASLIRAAETNLQAIASVINDFTQVPHGILASKQRNEYAHEYGTPMTSSNLRNIDERRDRIESSESTEAI